MNTNTNTNVILIDVGYGFTKTVAANSNGIFFQKTFPSIVREITTPISELQSFRVTGISEGFIRSTLYRILFKYALSQCDVECASISTCLSVHNYTSQCNELTSYIKTWCEEVGLHVEQVNVIPQFMDTYLNTLNGYEGDLAEFLDAHVGVVDIGDGTIDCSEIVHGEFVEGKTKSMEEGVHCLYDEILTDIESAHGELGLRIIDIADIIKSGAVSNNKKDIDVMSIVQSNKAQSWKKIEAFIHSVWPDLNVLKKLIITGGGFKLYEGEIRSILKTGM